MRQRRDAALFPNYFGQNCYYSYYYHNHNHHLIIVFIMKIFIYQSMVGN